MRLIWALLAVLLLGGLHVQADDDVKKPKSDQPADAKSALEALRQEVSDSAAPFIEKYRQAKTATEKAAIKEEFNVKAAPYAIKFLALAEKHPKDPAVFEALIQVIVMGREKEMPAIDKAIGMLLKDFADDERMNGIYAGMSSSDSPGVERFLRTALEKGGKKEVQGQAALGLAKHFKARAELATVSKQPQADQLSKDAEKYFQLVMDKYGDVKSGGGMLADVAKPELFEMKFLSIGKTAPETEGQDTDGKRFKLSDYRGKVVILDFWAGW